MEARAIKFETVAEHDGILLVPGIKAGEKAEIFVLRPEEQAAEKRPTRSGWLKGKIEIMPGFDDPIPGMEEYM